MIRAIDRFGFEADSHTPYPVGALVRLRLPGAGSVLARITQCDDRLTAAFVNPVGPARLAMALGSRARAASA